MSDDQVSEPVVWAADLVAALEASGTPRGKLEAVRDAILARWRETATLPESDPARHLSAAEASAILADEFGARHGTARKAQQLIETGQIAPPRRDTHGAESVPAPPRDKKPKVQAAASAGGTNTPKPTVDAPGVRPVAVDIPTVGPQPVKAKKPQVQAPAPPTVANTGDDAKKG